MIEYKRISMERLNAELFSGFSRRQEVTKCWRREGGRWVVKDIAFVDDWDSGDHERVLRQLEGVLQRGGAVWGAFDGDTLKGFASVNGGLIGSRKQYAVLRPWSRTRGIWRRSPAMCRGSIHYECIKVVQLNELLLCTITR